MPCRLPASEAEAPSRQVRDSQVGPENDLQRPDLGENLTEEKSWRACADFAMIAVNWVRIYLRRKEIAVKPGVRGVADLASRCEALRIPSRIMTVRITRVRCTTSG